MTTRTIHSLKIKGYKCFREANDYQGFDEIKSVNVIIGKNNTGKSKILEYLGKYIKDSAGTGGLHLDSHVQIIKKLEENELTPVFQRGVTTDALQRLAITAYGDDWNDVGQYYVGKYIKVTSNNATLLDSRPELFSPETKRLLGDLANQIKGYLKNPFNGYEYLSIQAERDIKKESLNFSSGSSYRVLPDGTGLTELIVRCRNEERGYIYGRQKLVENTLLDKMNEVLAPDLHFTRIDVKVGDNERWEVYLEEEKKGGIKLSDCGSGIKTILFVMVMLYVIPKLSENKKFIFAFEELENNLHPSLERKLLAHIRDYMKEHPDDVMFITTHSNIAIDMFSKSDDAQILRSYNDGEASFLEKVTDWNQQNNLLNDLGVKASDVLQANCVVWLEGPSDKIYFDKWISLFNEGEPLEDGLHYQCVFYGGAILAHYSAAAEEEEDDKRFIKMLHINRHAVILMDSDKAKEDDEYKDRVKKILADTAGSKNSVAWVTQGREIENYIPASVLESYFGKKPALDEFSSVGNEYKSIKNVGSFDKVRFASEITKLPAYTREALEGQLDLKEKMAEVIEHIRNCNS